MVMPCGPSDSEDEYMASLSPYDRTFLENYGIRYPAQLLSAPVVRLIIIRFGQC
jgi:hypothetical protein